ncbi:MAG: DUF2007 domain-containing protein [Bacteroidia bacterium]|jgi:hypothetical protein|nr:DUF2007 domain-containing protein [Bacteroidia bacterium]
MESNFNIVYQTTNPIDAEMIIQLLEDHQIVAFSMNKLDSSYLAFGRIEIYCPADQYVYAKHIIKKHT